MTRRIALFLLAVALHGIAFPLGAEEAPVPPPGNGSGTVDGGIIGRRPAGEPGSGTVSPPVSGGDALKMVLALSVVIGALVGGVWLLRKMAPGVASGSDNRLIEIVSRSAVGPKQSLLLVRTGSRLLLLGVSPDSMQKLSEFDAASGPGAVPGAQAATAGERAKPFGTMIRDMVSGFRATPVGEFEAEEAVEFRVRREIDAIRRKLSAWEEEEKPAPAGDAREGERSRSRRDGSA